MVLPKYEIFKDLNPANFLMCFDFLFVRIFG